MGNATLKTIKSTVPVLYKKYLNRSTRKLSAEKCLTAEQVEQIKISVSMYMKEEDFYGFR